MTIMTTEREAIFNVACSPRTDGIQSEGNLAIINHDACLPICLSILIIARSRLGFYKVDVTCRLTGLAWWMLLLTQDDLDYDRILTGYARQARYGEVKISKAASILFEGFLVLFSLVECMYLQLHFGRKRHHATPPASSTQLGCTPLGTTQTNNRSAYGSSTPFIAARAR